MIAHIVSFVGSKGLAYVIAFLGTAIGASLVMRVLNKIPLESWYAFLRKTSNLVSVSMNNRLTKKIWEPLETFIENVIVNSGQAIVDGFDQDDDSDGQKS